MKKIKTKKKILVAGATGYLGGHIVKELHKHKDYDIYILVRDSNKIKQFTGKGLVGEITNPETIEGIC